MIVTSTDNRPRTFRYRSIGESQTIATVATGMVTLAIEARITATTRQDDGAPGATSVDIPLLLIETISSG
jgi:hypothetical protein